MVKQKITWSKTAYLQRKSILLYWLQKNKSNAYPKKLLTEIQKNTKQLSEFPEIGKPTDIKNVRVLAMDNFLYSKTASSVNFFVQKFSLAIRIENPYSFGGLSKSNFKIFSQSSISLVYFSVFGQYFA